MIAPGPSLHWKFVIHRKEEEAVAVVVIVATDPNITKLLISTGSRHVRSGPA
jgi:hypothetical protein